MIDARQHRDPAIVPGLITQATEVAGSQKELAARLGVTPRYLRMVSNVERRPDYGIQVMLSIIASGQN